MEGKKCTSSQSHDSRDDAVKEIAAENVKQEPKIGEIIWIKLSRSLWWPAVVVSSNFNRSNKSGDRLMGNVRVRLYGSYKYMVVDPFKWHSEFQIILKQNNGCYQEIFKKALEQDNSGSKSGQVKRKSKSKDVEEPDHHEVKKKSSKQDVTPKKKNNKLNTPTSDRALSGRSQELSARRTKVMQSLGLIPPSGSPFQKIDAFI